MCLRVCVCGAQQIKVNLQEKHKRTPLWLACHHAATACADMEPVFVAIVRLLLEYPEVDVNQSDAQGRSPLWWMVDKGQLTLANALMMHPAVSAGPRLGAPTYAGICYEIVRSLA